MVAGKNHGNVYLCLCNTFHDDSLNVLKEKKMGAIYKSITNGTTMQSMQEWIDANPCGDSWNWLSPLGYLLFSSLIKGSTLADNAKLERAATGLDDSCVPEKENLSRLELWAETNKIKFYWVVVNSCLLHIYRIGKFMAKFLWFYVTTCSI